MPLNELGAIPLISIRQLEDFVRRFKVCYNADDPHPPFAFMIGAGFSKSAGIPLAAEMADELGQRLYSRAHGGLDAPTEANTVRSWLIDSCHPSGLEGIREGNRHYAAVMDLAGPGGAAEYVLECCKRGGGKLNWAHTFLGQMAAEGVADVFVTTNFDDLIQRSLIYHGLMPTVCSHSESALHLLGPELGPVIFHLHGTAGNYDMRHLPRAMMGLGSGAAAFLHQVLGDYGLIVIGYGGGRDTFMTTMIERCRSSAPRNGLYWVAHEKTADQLDESVKELLTTNPDHCFLIANQDADEFMLRLCSRDGLGLSLPKPLVNPLGYVEAVREAFPQEVPFAEADELRAALIQTKQTLERVAAEVRGEPTEVSDPALFGSLLVLKGEDREAIRVLEAYLKENPTDLNAHFSLAVAHQRRNELEPAMAAYRRCIEIKPDFHEALINLGTAASDFAQSLWNSRPERAKALFEESFGLFQRTLNIKHDAHDALNNWGSAASDFARCLWNSDAERSEAVFYEAFELYRKAVAIKPDKYEAFYNWGTVTADFAQRIWDSDPQRAEALFQKSFQLCRRAVEIRPDSDQALYNWGTAVDEFARRLWDSQRDRATALHKAALQLYERALEIKPDKLEALNNWAGGILRLYASATKDDRTRMLGDLCQLAERMRSVEQVQPEALAYNLACLLARIGLPQEAFPRLKKALASGRVLWSDVQQDPDWDDLRDHPEYVRLRAQYEQPDEPEQSDMPAPRCS